MAKSTSKPDTLGIAELAANLAEAQDLSKARAKSILDGESIKIPAGRKVVFKTAKGLKDQM